jgi:putative ABC transport system permease protein
MKFLLLVAKNLRRNLLRTALSGLAVVVLVGVATLILTVVRYTDLLLSDNAKELKMMVRERWQPNSQLPPSYLVPISQGAASRDEDVRPVEFLAWQHYSGALDRAQNLALLAFDPAKLRTMVDALEDLDPALPAAIDPRQGGKKEGVLLGRKHVDRLGLRVGDRFRLTGRGICQGIDLEFEVAGVLPEGGLSDWLAIMNGDYFNDAVDAYRGPGRSKHALDQTRLNGVSLRFADPQDYGLVARQVVESPLFQKPQVKCETMAAVFAGMLEAYRDLFWGAKWLLLPAILVTMTLVVANAIAINVRERQKEMALLKVLGFHPRQILTLVVGEALLVGGVSGLVGAGLTLGFFNYTLGGLKFPVAMISNFLVPVQALAWGLGMGAGAALLGSLAPAWTARSVKVADVFSKVA